MAGLHPGDGILEHDCPGGFYPEHSGCLEKRIGLRLTAEVAFLKHDAVDPRLEQIRDLRLFEDRCAVR
jgi:hypothetical protein